MISKPIHLETPTKTNSPRKKKIKNTIFYIVKDTA